MKNKNGFTLVELTMSLALISLVMIFVMKFITEIRKDEDTISSNTSLILTNTAISKKINNDIIESGGISSLECIENTCTIILKNEEEKVLETTNEGTILTYKSITKNKKELSRVLPNNSKFSINGRQTDELFILEIKLGSTGNYDIEIVNKKI